MPDPTKFPDGISGTADQVHNLGLKLGIYSSKCRCLRLPALPLIVMQVRVRLPVLVTLPVWGMKILMQRHLPNGALTVGLLPARAR